MRNWFFLIFVICASATLMGFWHGLYVAPNCILINTNNCILYGSPPNEVILVK